MFNSNSTPTFADFLLKKELIQALQEAEIHTPYDHQREALPAALLGSDLIVQSRSGMGKTLIPVITTLQDDYANGSNTTTSTTIQTLFIAHTREMCIQIHNEFMRFSKFMNIDIQVVFGGVPFRVSERIVAQTPAVLIGTPGRLIHLLEHKCIELRTLRRFIVDEADRLMEYETRKQIQTIFTRTSKGKQTILLGATINEQSIGICRKFTKNAKEIFDKKELTLVGLQQYEMEIDESKKIKTVCKILDELDFRQAIIFTKTQLRASSLDKELTKIAFPSLCIHGGMEQGERFNRFYTFRDSFSAHRILVCTDLFGRGIDLAKVNLIINFDMAQTTEEYLHRVGRASRAMTYGSAISFVSASAEKQLMKDIQQQFAVKVFPIEQDDIKGLNENFLY